MVRWWVMSMVLVAGTLSVAAQTSRPAAPDPYKDVALAPSKTAAPTTQAAGTVGSGGGNSLDMTRVVIALAIVVVAIIVIGRTWKKLGLPGAGGKSSGALQVVSRLTLSPKQQVLLIRVGRRAVLVGNSGTRMDRLCEIADAEEVAGLLGQTASERDDSVTSSFDEVLGGAEREYTEPPAPSTPGPAGSETTAQETQGEIQDLMEKVRSLSRQFRRGEA